MIHGCEICISCQHDCVHFQLIGNLQTKRTVFTQLYLLKRQKETQINCLLNQADNCLFNFIKKKFNKYEMLAKDVAHRFESNLLIGPRKFSLHHSQELL